MNICLKELRETHVWLKFTLRMNLLQNDEIHPVIVECNELISIFVKSITTAQKNEHMK